MAVDKQIHLSPKLGLPLEVAGQVVAIFGVRESGKSNSAGVFVEELLDRGQQVIVIDPTDAHWGLRSGYPIFIFGGPHGDIPLTDGDGKVLAEFLIIENVPVILSIRHLRKAAQRRFVTDLAEELYHLKGRPEHRAPLTLVIDEAPLFAPQKVFGEMASVTGAVEDLCARGRSSGFGVVLISQRPATLNKDLLSQADSVITHRLVSPHDRKALQDWITDNTTVEREKEILSSLATMPAGEAWVWAPRFAIMARTQIRKRRTFDSSATPKVGQAATAQPKSLQEIDLGKLQAKLKASVEAAKENDPRELKRQMARLQARILEMERTAAQTAESQASSTGVEPEVLKRLQAALEEAEGQVQDAIAITSTLPVLERRVGALEARLTPFQRTAPPGSAETARLSERTAPPSAESWPPPDRTAPRRRAETDGSALPGPEEKLLTVLAQRAVYGAPVSLQDLAICARYVQSGGAFRNPLSRLRTLGYVADAGRGVRITSTGRAALGEYAALPEGKDLLHWWLVSLPGPQRKLLAAVAEHGRPMTPEELAKKTEYEATGGAFRNPLSRLRSIGLVSGRGELEIHELLV
jgi:hypothetical protein